MYKFDLAKICNLLNCKKCHLSKMSLSKFAHLANTKNEALQVAYLASMRCRSMPENAFDILQTVHSVKTQKRHCQNL